jgi:hypothetical protein
MTKRPRRQGKSSQLAAFKKAAKALECDESEERFQEALRAIGKKS